MTWEEIRQQYPHRWLLLEAFGAYTHKARRITPHLDVIAEFGDDSVAAWAEYRRLHSADKSREFYIFHTDRIELDIHVMDAFRRIIEE
jgi:hypothetical protein